MTQKDTLFLKMKISDVCISHKRVCAESEGEGVRDSWSGIPHTPAQSLWTVLAEFLIRDQIFAWFSLYPICYMITNFLHDFYTKMVLQTLSVTETAKLIEGTIQLSS